MAYCVIQRFDVSDIDIAFFKNKLVHDIINIISDHDSNKGLPGFALNEDNDEIYNNIDYLKYFTISSHIVNSISDYKYKILIEFYNTDSKSYSKISESLTEYLKKSCYIYFNIKDNDGYVRTMDILLNSILLAIYK